MTTRNIISNNVDQVRLWLQKTTKDIHNVINNSNFQTEVHELYVDLGAIGTACQLIEEDDDTIVRFSTKFIADYFIKESRSGKVELIMHEARWKAHDLIEEFSEKGMHRDVLKEYTEQKGTEYKVVHCVYECAEKYYSVYILPDLNHKLKEETFNEFPYLTPRWSKASGEDYGRSPGMSCLPEIKVLNKMNETLLIGAQKKVDPPIQMPDDGFALPIVTRPGGINYYRSGSNDVIKPIFNDTNLEFGYQAMEDRRQRVRDTFYVDQLKLRQGGPMMTATEVLQRTEESMRLLGPMLGRMQSEYLRPLINRVFNIMLRKGKIKPAPAAMKGHTLDVRYSSLIAKSQRLADAQNILRTVQAVAPFMQMDPSVADNFNGDACARIVAGVYGFPQLGLRSAADVQKLRQQRAEAQQAQLDAAQEAQELQNAGQMANITQKVGANG